MRPIEREGKSVKSGVNVEKGKLDGGEHSITGLDGQRALEEGTTATGE